MSSTRCHLSCYCLDALRACLAIKRHSPVNIVSSVSSNTSNVSTSPSVTMSSPRHSRGTTTSPNSSNASSSSATLRDAFRGWGLLVSHICHFVELGGLLESNLVGRRLYLAKLVKRAVPSSTQGKKVGINVIDETKTIGRELSNMISNREVTKLLHEGKFEFDQCERRLW